MPSKTVINITTGAVETVDLTQAEIDEANTLAAAGAAREAARLAALPQFGGDDTPLDQVAAGVVQLRAYLALPAPTQAQSTAALKLLIRGFLFVLKRMLT